MAQAHTTTESVPNNATRQAVGSRKRTPQEEVQIRRRLHIIITAIYLMMAFAVFGVGVNGAANGASPTIAIFGFVMSLAGVAWLIVTLRRRTPAVAS